MARRGGGRGRRAGAQAWCWDVWCKYQPTRAPRPSERCVLPWRVGEQFGHLAEAAGRVDARRSRGIWQGVLSACLSRNMSGRLAGGRCAEWPSWRQAVTHRVQAWCWMRCVLRVYPVCACVSVSCTAAAPVLAEQSRSIRGGDLPYCGLLRLLTQLGAMLRHACMQLLLYAAPSHSLGTLRLSGGCAIPLVLWMRVPGAVDPHTPRDCMARSTCAAPRACLLSGVRRGDPCCGWRCVPLPPLRLCSTEAVLHHPPTSPTPPPQAKKQTERQAKKATNFPVRRFAIKA